MAKFENDYIQDISIDESALDVEWLEIPVLMATYGALVAKFDRLCAKQKEKIAVTKAELDKDIRTNPDKYGLTKIVEASVFNTILEQLEYQEENARLIDLKYELDMAQNAVWALQSKKAALENLVRLHGANYFAGPSVPRDLSHERLSQERSKQSNKAVGERMTRRKKQ